MTSVCPKNIHTRVVEAAVYDWVLHVSYAEKIYRYIYAGDILHETIRAYTNVGQHVLRPPCLQELLDAHGLHLRECIIEIGVGIVPNGALNDLEVALRHILGK